MHGAAASQHRIALRVPAGCTCRLPHVSFWHRSQGTPRVALPRRPGLPLADPAHPSDMCRNGPTKAGRTRALAQARDGGERAKGRGAA